MKTLKRKTTTFFVCFAIWAVRAQHQIVVEEGYSPQIGTMVSMLEDLRHRITEQVKDLDQAQTDFQYDEDANSIGALLMHLVSTEVYYQMEALEISPWTEAEQNRLNVAGELNEKVKNILKGKPVQYYLDLWNEVRQKTLSGLKNKDDAWFASDYEEGINNHFIWYHVMEHSANHMGQIATIKNRLP